ncbi:MAG: hypothetical protein ACD_46C00581G0011 [uncultured bacterium]|nr:MAG: hypothetical protein ACD_46C00581G0011 [uncultured bacterium]
MFISIFAATCRPENIFSFFENLAATCDDPNSFEVLIKLDLGDEKLIQIIDEYKKNSKFSIKYLATEKLDGYYSLDVGYNELLKIAHPDTYFCWLLTDEIRFETKGWDTVLRKYIGFYPDDVFRLKMSIFALKNYYDFFECLPCPDNYALTTRKWLEVTDGWGNFWGPDSWHQCVDYYLGLARNKNNLYGIWRSIPIFDIKVGGQEAGQGITDPNKLRERTIKIWKGWQKFSTHAAQENFNRLAMRLSAHITAHEIGLEQYILEENLFKKNIALLSKDHNICYYQWSFALPKFQIQLHLARKQIKAKHLFMYYHIRLQEWMVQYHHVYQIAKQIKRLTRRQFLHDVLKIKDYWLITTTFSIISNCLLLPANIFRHFISKFASTPSKNKGKLNYFFYDGKTLKKSPFQQSLIQE